MRKRFLENVKRFRRHILIAVLIILTGIVLAQHFKKIQDIFLGKFGKPEEKEVSLGFDEDERLPIKAYQLKRADFEDTMSILGSISGYQEIPLKFSVQGTIESFNFIEGERVREGDIIANLDQREALMKLRYSELELEKHQKLYDAGALSDVKLEQIRLEYESAKFDLDKTNMYAPTDGLMGAIEVQEGEVLSATDMVATLIDAKDVFVQLGIIEKDIHRISIGQKVKVILDAYPGKSFEGSVDTIVPIIEGRTRTMPVKVKVPNPKSMLKPGMFARTWVSAYEKKDALVVPNSALKKKKERYYVSLIHVDEEEDLQEEEKSDLDKRMEDFLKEQEEDDTVVEEGATGEIENKGVEVEYLASDYAVIEKGLAEGDVVIIDMTDELKDKTKVEIVELVESAF